jgi:cobalamin-dependent methionine synthase I
VGDDVPRVEDDLAQNLFRQRYSGMRMHSLGPYAQPSKTKEDVLFEVIESVRKENPEFKPRYDEKFFLMKKYY